MIGQNISHYKILEKLGEGGMGVVYKAQDLKLDRLVALKFLPHQLLASSEEIARFQQEAKAISALNHPNIATIYDVDEASGERFLALEYLPGGTLRSQIKNLQSSGRELSIAQVLDYGLQIAEGLAHAHQNGIVHRDVKTDNIMFTKEGRIKITDFGLAKLRGGAQLTKTGSTVGTAAYMSPEQITGAEQDYRSDIFSLGIVLYELTTGRLPFRGEHEAALSYSIVNEEPLPLKSLRPTIPSELEAVIGRCLEKDKDKRSQKAEEVGTDFRRLQQSISMAMTATQKRSMMPWIAGSLAILLLIGLFLFWPSKSTIVENKSIAVLPFANFSEDKESEYFSDGITEELINALSKLEGLHVAARTSSFVFKGKTEDVKKIGQQLGVNTLLEGSVRKSGNKIRITAQLINIADGYHLWSNTYERELKDVFAVQDDITSYIVSELKIKLHEGERSVISSRTTNPEAHDLYLRGRFFMNTLGEQGLRKALEYFRQALEKDPGYATPYAGIGFTYVWLADAYLSPREAYPRAKAAALKALELDSTNVEAHSALGSVLFLYDWNFPLAEKECRRAIQLSPNSFDAHFWYSQFLLLSGRLEEALVENDIGMRLDPLSALSSWQRVLCFFAARRFDQTIEQYKKMLELDPNFFYSDSYCGAAYREKGMYKECLEEYRKALQLTGEAPLHGLAITYAKMGKAEEARKILNELRNLRAKRYVPADEIAMIYANLDEKDNAFDWLNRAYEERSATLLFLKSWPEYDPIRSDPRFVALMKKVYGDK